MFHDEDTVQIIRGDWLGAGPMAPPMARVLVKAGKVYFEASPAEPVTVDATGALLGPATTFRPMAGELERLGVLYG